MRSIGLVPGFVVVQEDELHCYFLKDGKCSIYNDRPKVCRVMGTDRLPCPAQTTTMPLGEFFAKVRADHEKLDTELKGVLDEL